MTFVTLTIIVAPVVAEFVSVWLTFLTGGTNCYLGKRKPKLDGMILGTVTEVRDNDFFERLTQPHS